MVRTVLTVLLALALGGACSDGRERPNLLLITVDTLRADRLGAWGYERPTSPALDALASQSVVFADAQAHSSWTLPSLASLMTSHYSSTHRCWTFKSRLDESFTTLAELLADEGYDTAAVVNHVFLGRKHGLAQGFADFDEELVHGMSRSHEAITSPKVTNRGAAWLNAREPSDAPWFLWVHYFDPHEVYQPHTNLPHAFGREREEDLYDGEIAFTDRSIGQLLRVVGKRGLTPETVVVVFADHGEEFGDHGGLRHGHTLHKELLHVPLMIRAPGHAPRRVEQAVRGVDVLPTVLELFDLPVRGDFAGTSLVPLMRGEALGSLPVLAELRLRENRRAESLSLDGWKLVVDLSRERAALYDLANDPKELRDVASEEPDRVAALSARLDEMRGEAERAAGAYAAAGDLELSAEDLDDLRELGYVGDEE